MPLIVDNLKNLLQQIEELSALSGRDRDEVRLVAVSKTRSLDEVKLLAEAGQCAFGENTVQDALTKIPFLDYPNLQWHFIGHLQSNKAGHIPGHFQWIHSVDSVHLASKLSNVMGKHDASSPLNCLLQINISGEASKHGIAESEIIPVMDNLLEANLPGLAWRGLMTMGVRGNENATRQSFNRLRLLLEKCRHMYALDTFDQLSMGMSDDYHLAIKEGATMLRIGSGIFGKRQGK